MKNAKKRWNLLDWGLLAVAAAILVGGVWLIRTKPWKRMRQEVLTCTLRTAPFDSETRSAGVLPRAGDTVRTAAGGETVGRVLAVAVVPQTVLTADGDALALTPCPDRYVAEVTVRLTLADRTVGSHRIAAGGTADLILGGYFAAGCGILSVEVTELAE
ncbi:MAG TPA: hypothetical protein DDW30_02990 [Clostridiales bacterium]|nr:hypothetical protein [Clostridiales bacterium]